MRHHHIKWLKRGFKDFFLIILLGMMLVLFCFYIISALVLIGMQPEYASTIISLCLLFAGSMMFSYFEFKRDCLEKEKDEINCKPKKQRVKEKK